MSLLMDALKRAEEAKQFPNYSSAEESDPHVLEWTDQKSSEPKIEITQLTAKTVGTQVIEKSPDTLALEEDISEKNQDSELASSVTEELPISSKPQAAETVTELDIYPLETPSLTSSAPADTQMIKEKKAPTSTFDWQNEIILPVDKTAIVSPAVDSAAKDDKDNAAGDLKKPEKPQEISKDQAVFEEILVEEDMTGPQAAERLFAATTPSVPRKRTVLLIGLLVALVGLGVAGYFYIDTLIGGSSAFLAKPGEKSFQRPPRPMIPENTAMVADAVKTESKVTEPTPAVSSQSTIEQVANTKPTGTLTANPSQIFTQAQEVSEKLLALAPKSVETKKNIKEQDQSSPKSEKMKKLLEKPILSHLPNAEKKSIQTAATPPVSSDTKGNVNTPASVAPPTEIKIIQMQRHSTPAGIKNVLDTTLTNAYKAFQQGDDTMAQAAYTRVLQQDPNNRDVLLGLAAIALRGGNAHKAQQYYQRVLQLYPQDTVAQVGLISALGENASKYNESQLQVLLAKTPQAAYIHFNLGNLYARQGQWAQAQQAYFEAYRYDSQRADYAYNLAISLDQLNQPRLASTYYQRALELTQNDTRQDFNFDPQVVNKRLQALTHHEGMKAVN